MRTVRPPEGVRTEARPREGGGLNPLNLQPLSRVLVLGGSGFVGRSLCERLVRDSGSGGLRITVPTRQLPQARSVQFLPTVEPVLCDVHDDEQLTGVLRDHDAVVNLVGILHGSAADFDRVHSELPRRLARACVHAGVSRLVHVSALGADADAPSAYLRSKAAGEAAVRAALPSASVLRPSVMFGEHDRFLNLFAALQAFLPVLPLAGAKARFQPVWVVDVAEAIARCLRHAATPHRLFECAGPREYTLAELVRLAGEYAGRPRPVLPLPESLALLQGRILEWLPGKPLMSRDNVLSMRVPNVASGTMSGLEALGIRASAVEAVVPTYLSPNAGVARFDRWRAVRA